MKKSYYNGVLLPSEEVTISVANRAFRYGDGVFETMVVKDGKLRNWDYHFARMQRSWEALDFEYPSDYKESFFWQDKIMQVVDNQLDVKVRWQVFRDNGGLYTPAKNTFSYLIETFPLPEKKDKGLHIGLYTHTPLMADNWLSNLKTCHALPYILAGNYRKKQGYDDCLLVNQYGRIVEAISSNIFIYLDKKWRTPPLSEGCVAGTTRAALLDIFKEKGIAHEEMPITEDDILLADSVFLTNAVSGISWVEQFGDSMFEEVRMTI